MKEETFLNLSDENCLSLIRLIAAFQVMYGHIAEHLELQNAEAISYVLTYFRGVPIFSL